MNASSQLQLANLNKRFQPRHFFSRFNYVCIEVDGHTGDQDALWSMWACVVLSFEVERRDTVLTTFENRQETFRSGLFRFVDHA